MSALSITFRVNGQNYIYTQWVPADDATNVLDHDWLKSKVSDAFDEMLDDIMPSDLACVSPIKVDELGINNVVN